MWIRNESRLVECSIIGVDRVVALVVVVVVNC